MGTSSDSESSGAPNGTRSLVAVCTYQEALNIRPMIQGIRKALPDAEVLVVDDDSPDGTADLVRELQEVDSQIRLIVRRGQRGLGGAIVAAMKQSVEGQYDYFLNLDADLSHDPAELPKLFDTAIADPELAVVIGSRYIPGGAIVGWPLRRRWMSKVVNRFATGVLGLPVRDCSGSMRCYRVAALQSVGLDDLECSGYALLEELLVKIHRQGGAMKEVPITFTERELGDSKLTIGEAVRSMGFMIRLAFSSSRH